MLRTSWIAAFTVATVVGLGGAFAEPEAKSAKSSGGQSAPSSGPSQTGTAGTQAREGTDPVSADKSDKFQEYVGGEKVEDTRRTPAKVGEVLPETLKFHEIGPQWNMTKYMYTLINGDTVLVERGTRKVVQIVNKSRDDTKKGTTVHDR